MYQPIHSDFIIHWTGKKDIDDKYDWDWARRHSSITDDRVTKLYIERLKNILEYGLWMTKNSEDKNVNITPSYLYFPQSFRIRSRFRIINV